MFIADYFSMNILEIIKSLPKERIADILHVLDPLEREIFNVFLSQETAISIFDVEKTLVDRYFNWLKLKLIDLDSEGILKADFDRRRIERIKEIPLVEVFEHTFFPGSRYVPFEKFLEIMNKHFFELENQPSESAKVVRAKENFLRNFFPFPSYSRIARIVDQFVLCNLLIKRKSEGKAKYLYAVNPLYLSHFRKHMDLVGTERIKAGRKP